MFIVDFLRRANCFFKRVKNGFPKRESAYSRFLVCRVRDIPFKIDGYDVKQGVDARCIHGRKEKTRYR